MKKTGILAATIAAIALLWTSDIDAQQKKQHNWQEKMMSEKIAFITAELELTPDEAQVFWPVYNQIAKEKHQSHKAVMTAFGALRKAMEQEGVSEQELKKLLDNYLAANSTDQNICKEYADRYRKVLPEKKVAKLYLAEEKYRRHHIHKMKSAHHGTGKPGANPSNQKSKK